MAHCNHACVHHDEQLGASRAVVRCWFLHTAGTYCGPRPRSLLVMLSLLAALSLRAALSLLATLEEDALEDLHLADWVVEAPAVPSRTEALV